MENNSHSELDMRRLDPPALHPAISLGAELCRDFDLRSRANGIRHREKGATKVDVENDHLVSPKGSLKQPVFGSLTAAPSRLYQSRVLRLS